MFSKHTFQVFHFSAYKLFLGFQTEMVSQPETSHLEPSTNEPVFWVAEWIIFLS